MKLLTNILAAKPPYTRKDTAMSCAIIKLGLLNIREFTVRSKAIINA